MNGIEITRKVTKQVLGKHINGKSEQTWKLLCISMFHLAPLSNNGWISDRSFSWPCREVPRIEPSIFCMQIAAC